MRLHSPACLDSKQNISVLDGHEVLINTINPQAKKDPHIRNTVLLRGACRAKKKRRQEKLQTGQYGSVLQKWLFYGERRSSIE